MEGSAVRGHRVVDAHTHVACADTERFPVRATGVGSDWWHGGGGSPEDLIAALDAVDVARAVVVQAVGVYGHDCRCATSTVARWPERLSLVVSLDMGGTDPASALAHLATQVRPVRVAGVRLFGVGADGAPWLGDARVDEVWAVAGDLGITVVPCVFSFDLDAVGEVAARHPHVPVAVDHCGFPDREGADGWAAVHRLAAVASVSLKVTSYVLEAAERDEGDPAPVVDALVARFGTARLCWGSDHPQDRSRDYAGKLALARHAARHLDAGQVVDLFARTAARLWFAP